jgi:hypothetical protein
MKRIVSCGCSITHGYYVKNNQSSYLAAYPEVFASRYNHEIINLAKPGSSNYFVAKQIEFAITLQPDFLIVGFTSPYRFDYHERDTEHLDHRPTIKDWEYKSMGKTEYTNVTGILNSNPIPRLVTFPHKKEFVEYALKYTDPSVSADKERYTILGMIHKLNSTGIPYVGIDWLNVLDPEETPSNICKTMSWKKYGEKFGHDGGGHFDQLGHDVAATELELFIEKNKLWNYK